MGKVAAYMYAGTRAGGGKSHRKWIRPGIGISYETLFCLFSCCCVDEESLVLPFRSPLFISSQLLLVSNCVPSAGVGLLVSLVLFAAATSKFLSFPELREIKKEPSLTFFGEH